MATMDVGEEQKLPNFQPLPDDNGDDAAPSRPSGGSGRITRSRQRSSPPTFRRGVSLREVARPSLQRAQTDRALHGGSSLRLLNLVEAQNEEQQEHEDRIRMTQEQDARFIWGRVGFWAMLIILGFVMVGLTRNTQCAEPRLWTWLLVNSSALVIFNMLTIYRRYHYARRQRVHEPKRFLNTFFFIWWIVGQVWLYSVDANSCDPRLWYTVLVFIVIDYMRMCCPCLFLICCFPWIAPYLMEHAVMEGAEEEEILELPMTKYVVNPEKPDEQCSICLAEFEVDEDVRELPLCAHAFHAPCIDRWLKLNRTCPLCRRDIRERAEADDGAVGQEGNINGNDQRV